MADAATAAPGGGGGAGGGAAPAVGRAAPADFLRSVIGRPVTVRLTTGVDFRGAWPRRSRRGGARRSLPAN